MRSLITLRHGEGGDAVVANRGNDGSRPDSTILVAVPGETLASITQRAYGANTAAYRAKIESANSTLSGTIRVPR